MIVIKHIFIAKIKYVRRTILHNTDLIKLWTLLYFLKLFNENIQKLRIKRNFRFGAN